MPFVSVRVMVFQVLNSMLFLSSLTRSEYQPDKVVHLYDNTPIHLNFLVTQVWFGYSHVLHQGWCGPNTCVGHFLKRFHSWLQRVWALRLHVVVCTFKHTCTRIQDVPFNARAFNMHTTNTLFFKPFKLLHEEQMDFWSIYALPLIFTVLSPMHNTNLHFSPYWPPLFFSIVFNLTHSSSSISSSAEVG